MSAITLQCHIRSEDENVVMVSIKALHIHFHIDAREKESDKKQERGEELLMT